MALQGKLVKDDNSYKFDFNNVYYKIDDCQIDTLIEEIRVGVRGYASEYARQNKGMGIYKKVFLVKFSDLTLTSFSKDDILTAAYNYLKTLDEFKESKDV